ncbi:phenylacetate-CoA oxygenase subunit PaaC [Cryomorphaceae bacterium]|nr:phenylacetate-CoA oxygenase subunit PaaC [Cryomorphaceae bacterium]
MEIKEALFHYALRMGDNSLILGHRLSEWCGHGPILEQDIALINVALDLIGQSRSYLSYAGELEGEGRSEDDLAYLRREREFRNVLLTELPNGDFGRTLVRQFLFDVFHYLQLERLTESSDEQLAAIATKSLKEVTYHLRYSSEWMIRLGDGTEESHRRVQEPLNDLWAYTGEMFEMDDVDETLVGVGIAPDLASLKPAWENKVREILTEATLDVPESGWMHSGGRKGVHSEHLGYLLSELQYLQRSIPNAKW